MRFVLVRAMFVFALEIAPTLLCVFWEHPWTTNTSLSKPSNQFSATSVHACLKGCFEQEGCAITYFIESKCYLVIDGAKNGLKEVEANGSRYYTFSRTLNTTSCPTIRQLIGNGSGR